MSRYNEELRKAGMLLALDGLRPAVEGAQRRASTAEGGATVTDGPFAEAKEVVGGYWLIQARSKEEALEWATASPARGGGSRSGASSRSRTSREDVQRGESPPTKAPEGRVTERHARDRGGLADRVAAPDRRPGADGRRRRPGRGPGAGRAGRGAGAVAARRRPGQPGRLADGRPRRTGRSTGCAASKTLERKHEEIAREHRRLRDGAPRLRGRGRRRRSATTCCALIFTCCHPVLSTRGAGGADPAPARRPDDDEIARAFLVAEPTVAQRLVRAKRTLREAAVPFEVPRGPELDERLASVLEVIYLVFNEGYAATAGDDWMRPTLCEEALRLGRDPRRAGAATSPRSTGWSR